MSNKALYKFYLNCGRMGFLDGLFIANKDDVKSLIESKRTVYFGEVLGIYSDIYSELDDENLILVSEDEKVIEILQTLANESGSISGHNPIAIDKERQEDI